MLKILAFVFAFACGSIQLHSQYDAWYYSTLRVPLAKTDSAFLVSSELKVWRAAKSSHDVWIFRGRFRWTAFDVKHSIAETEKLLSDSSISELTFVPRAELISAWNFTADTFHIMSFAPMITGRDPWGGTNINDTTCWVHLPLCGYHSFLEEWQMKKMQGLVMSSLTTAMRATNNNDTLERIIEFVPDSNQYLPQASYLHLASALQNSTLWYGLSAFNSSSVNVPMKKQEVEDFLVQWDTSVVAEDPNNPGAFIYAPVKHEELPVSILVYEKWKPDVMDTTRKVWIKLLFVPSYRQYHREVIAYGVRYTSGKILWYRAAEARTCLQKNHFNWAPYDESFRAERYECMQIDMEF